MSQTNNQRKKRFNITLFLSIAIIVLVASIGFGLYKHYQDTHDQQVITAIKPDKATPSPTETAEVVELPEAATDANSFQCLLNKASTPLDASFVPSDLTDPENVNSTSGVFTVRAEVATQLEAMVTAARDAGIEMQVTGGYRSYDEQEQLYTTKSSLLTESQALTACEKPGFSEHQLGLAVDFTDDPSTPNETEAFAETEAGKWLAEHAHEYGFILRYPDGKQSITKYNYMPWHYRYVGTDLANTMFEKGVDYTLEEYYGY